MGQKHSGKHEDKLENGIKKGWLSLSNIPLKRQILRCMHSQRQRLEVKERRDCNGNVLN